MKILSILLAIFLLLQFSSSQRPLLPNEKNVKYTSKFFAVTCSSTDNSTAYFTFCYAKSYSRTISTLNFGVQILKSFNLLVQITASYRYGNIYREVMDTKLIDWCSVMNGINSNLFLKFILDIIRDSIPKLFQKCPYQGLIEYRNITINDEITKKISIFPEGQYNYNITIADKPRRILLVLTAFVEVKSPLKNSFG